MKTILGANWLTSILGFGEKAFYALAAFILLYPDAVKALIPPENDKGWSVFILLLGFLLGGTKDYHTKDKAVTGGTIQNDPPALAPDSPGIKLPLLLLACVLVGLGLTACGTNSPFVAKSEAQPNDGKIPVSATVSTSATGNAQHASDVDYSVNGAVTFGATGPLNHRAQAIAELKKLGFTPTIVPVAAPAPTPKVGFLHPFAPPAPSPTPTGLGEAP